MLLYLNGTVITVAALNIAAETGMKTGVGSNSGVEIEVAKGGIGADMAAGEDKK